MIAIDPLAVGLPDVLTVEQAAAFLQVGRSTLYDAIGRGDVPYQRIGRHIRLSRDALVRWLAGSCGAVSKKVGS